MPGHDLTIKAPIGVSITNKNGRIIGDINAVGDVIKVAEGARGGGPTNDFKAKKAALRQLRLDLKLVADVGLVGFPNAGKSTLLTRLSNATPKIAAYPFTTLQPQLGVITDSSRAVDGRQLQVTVADLPGLVEGAHRNVGLGHSFLKHVERTKALLFVIDVNGFQLSQDPNSYRSAFDTLLLLTRELEMYDPSLLHRSAILCLNKVDDDSLLDTVSDFLERFKQFQEGMEPVTSLPVSLYPSSRVKFSSIHIISAKEGINLQKVVDALLDLVLDRHVSERQLSNIG